MQNRKIAVGFPAVLALLSMGMNMEGTGPNYPHIKFAYTADDIAEECTAAVEEAQSTVDGIAGLSAEQVTFRSVAVGLERAMNTLDERVGTILFLKETSPSTVVQEAASGCQEQVDGLYAKLFSRADLYRKFELVAQKFDRLDAQDAKLLQESVRRFKKSGAALSETQRAEAQALQEQLSKLENDFSTNLAQANDTESFTREELEGLDDDFLSGLEQETDASGVKRYRITLLDASSYLPVAENAVREQTRKRLVTAHEKVAAAQNTPLLEQAIVLRDRLAKLMGFATFADYALDSQMAKSSARVTEFLGELAIKLKPKAESDLAVLLARKKQDDPNATAIELWDWRYYANVLRREKYSVDEQAIKEYFPVDPVLTRVFELYQKLLGVTYKEIVPAYAWAPDVRLFEVRDAQSNALFGHFYLDLYPRANKYKHFAAFDIVHARENEDGSYHTPVSAMVGNFPKATPGKPALLTHDDVETLFHEFGHIMHQTLTTARYSSLAGTNVRTDFVEAPSQMLENWVWDKAILRKISSHYQTGEPLAESLIDQMLAAKHFNEGVYWSRQLFFASVDMVFHSNGATVDTTEVWNRMQPEIMGIAETEGAQAQATFGHIMGGYEAGYYSYLWSKVFAQDMFTLFEKDGLESATVGGRYRQWILAPGGTQEPDALLRGFLGREPNMEAFYRSLGIE